MKPRVCLGGDRQVYYGLWLAFLVIGVVFKKIPKSSFTDVLTCNQGGLSNLSSVSLFHPA